jgi:TIR domain
MERIEKTVFISYRRTDQGWGQAIFGHLTQHGYDVFIDYDGIASGNFETAILENIRARAHFLVLLTPTALDRCGDSKDWMRREIEAALDSRRNIVPLMLEGFDFGKAEIAGHLTGKLERLKNYNGLEIPKARFFLPEMKRLRDEFLSVPVDAVLHPASDSAQQVATEQKEKAVRALADGYRQQEDEQMRQPQQGARKKDEGRRRRQAAERIVFVSYAKDIVPSIMKQLVSALIDRGYRIWLYDPLPYGFSNEELDRIDRQQAGLPYLKQRLDAVRNSETVLFLISNSTVTSDSQMQELNIAMKHGRVVPCIVSEEFPEWQLPEKLRDLHVKEITERNLTGQRVRDLIDNVENAPAPKERWRMILPWISAGIAAGIAAVGFWLLNIPQASNPSNVPPPQASSPSSAPPPQASNPSNVPSPQASNPQAPNMTFFVTSRPIGNGGNLGGLEGADAHCQQLAATVGAATRPGAPTSAAPKRPRPRASMPATASARARGRTSRAKSSHRMSTTFTVPATSSAWTRRSPSVAPRSRATA